MMMHLSAAHQLSGSLLATATISAFAKSHVDKVLYSTLTDNVSRSNWTTLTLRLNYWTHLHQSHGILFMN